jgi:hypothetical protein
LTQNIKHKKVKMWRREAGNYVDKHCTITLLLSVIVYILWQNCRAAEWWRVNCFFLSETFLPYFFHVHLNILDKVVSSWYANFGTPVYIQVTPAALH